MVHVRMREQNQIEGRQLLGAQGGLHKATRPHLGEAPADPDPRLQDRIGEYECAVDVEQHRCMAEPGHSQVIIGPV
jgi:hypothetical protein